MPRRRGHPRRYACRRRAGSHRRAARRPGVPGHPSWLCRPAGLAGRVQDRRPGRHRRDWQLRRRTGSPCRRSWHPGGRVDRSDRQDRRRQGKSDPLDAVSAARAAQSGRARGAPKGRDGAVEAIRALMVARRSAAEERTQTINQARALLLTGPDDLRARFTRHTPAALVTGLASLRPRPGDVAGYAVRVALRAPPRHSTLTLSPLLAVYGVGPRTAALLLITARDHPGRLRSEAAWAHLCGVAPIPASSGKVTRHRLNPALRKVANRLVGILHGCLKTRTPSTTKPPPGRPAKSSSPLTFKLLGCLSCPQTSNNPVGTPTPQPRTAASEMSSDPLDKHKSIDLLTGILVRRSLSVTNCRPAAGPSAGATMELAVVLLEHHSVRGRSVPTGGVPPVAQALDFRDLYDKLNT